MSSNPRTYTESDALHDSAALHKALFKAKLIVFLGFGFHAQNMTLLQMTEPRTKTIMATVKNVNVSNKIDITSSLAGALRTDHSMIELFDMTAAEMLRELRLKIMMRVG